MSTGLSKKLLEKLEAYKADANKCTLIKYIFNEHDLNEDNDTEQNSVFKPEYTHQIFGDDELIFGFKNLKVLYYLTPGLMHAYIGLKYAEKITPQRFDGIESDDVYDAFQKFGCSPGFTRSLDLFCSEKLRQDLEFKPFGTKIHEYSKASTVDSSNVLKYEIYKVDLNCADYHNQKFIDYLQRVQTMLIFFIETADFTDTDDDQWVYYFLYEKRKLSQDVSLNVGSGSLSERYVTIGFTSVYDYYAYPDKKRTRISQMLVMPPYQHGGHGAQLMECIYNDALQNSDVLDITAEGPSTNFIKLRDYVTCCMCMQLNSFKDKEFLKKGFSKEMIAEAMKRFKMPKLQTRRCYEILRLQVTNQNNANEWRDYRLEIKKRLYWPFLRNSRFARNAGNVVNQDENQVSEIPRSNGNGNGNGSIKKLPDRFNAPSGTTTIGFGPSPSSTTTIGFGAAPSKGVRFSEQPTVLTAKGGKSVGFKLNASCSSNEQDDDDSEDDEEMNSSVQSQTAVPIGNLLISEVERKKYLEKEFEDLVADYRNTLKRLENRA